LGGWRHLPADDASPHLRLSLAHLDPGGADPSRQGQGRCVVYDPRRGRHLGARPSELKHSAPCSDERSIRRKTAATFGPGTSANQTIQLAQSRHPIMCGMWLRCVSCVILFRWKRQQALALPCPRDHMLTLKRRRSLNHALPLLPAETFTRHALMRSTLAIASSSSAPDIVLRIRKIICIDISAVACSASKSNA